MIGYKGDIPYTGEIDMSKYVMAFKRFIVFNWPDFDPPSPFDCILGSFDTEEDADSRMRKEASEDAKNGPPESNYCIFDCEKRKIVSKHCPNLNSRHLR